MAHLHFNAPCTTVEAGRRRTDRVYYPATRARGSAYDRQARYIAREDREDLVYERSRNLPAWAEGNPHTYFRAAERYERANGGRL